MALQLDSYASSTLGKQAWDKNTKDVANFAENFANARDIGYLRYNYSRVSVVSSLSSGDTQDFFKVNIQSSGKLNFSVIETASSESSSTTDGPLKINVNDYLDAAGVKASNASDTSADTGRAKKMVGDGPLELDLNKYLYNAGLEIEEDQATDETIATDELDTALAETQNETDKAIELSDIRVQIYSYNGNKAEIIADSGADKNSDLYKAYAEMRIGDYQVNQKQDYYVKVSRSDSNKDTTKSSNYVMQFQIGDGASYKHDYLTTEASYNPLSSSSSNSSKNNLITSLLQNDPSQYGGATARILGNMKSSRTVASSLSLYNSISKLLRK